MDLSLATREQLTDPRWRLDNLYAIKNEHGQAVPFKLRPMQQKLMEEMWYFNLILKYRQGGASSFCDLVLLDSALFNSNMSCAIVADTEPKAKTLFDEKVLFPYSQLPGGFRRARPTNIENTFGLEFDNGSKIVVGTSVRGLTFQRLHISELGPICKREPLKAHEIKTGAFNTVHAGQMMFVESTSVGAEGLFYEMCVAARNRQLEGKPLTRMDWKLHFFPWYMEPRYRMPDHEIGLVEIPEDLRLYFHTLEVNLGISLDAGQRAWYVVKKREQEEDMAFEMPSTFEEAFSVSTEGRIFGTQMVRVRETGRIGSVPWIPHLPVNTFWDIGYGDKTAIWFHQYYNGDHRFIRYYENCGEDISHYVAYCRAQGYVFGKWYLPHDATSKRVNELNSTKARMILLGVSADDIEIVPRVQDKWVGSIMPARSILPLCRFDQVNAARGIWCLDHYEKSRNESTGAWRDAPREHHDANHGADAFQQFAMGWAIPKTKKKGSVIQSVVLDTYTGY